MTASNAGSSRVMLPTASARAAPPMKGAAAIPASIVRRVIPIIPFSVT
jgi:hypothetical protein